MNENNLGPVYGSSLINTLPIGGGIMKRQLTRLEKAALLVGMVRAFSAVGWPPHFTACDRATWSQRSRWAVGMLNRTAYDPRRVREVCELVDDELEGGEI